MLRLERPRGNVEVVASRRRASRSRAPRQLRLGAHDSTFPRYQPPSPVGRVRINLHESRCSHR